MGYRFEAKNVEEAIKITSGNSKFLEEEFTMTDEIRGFLESFKEGFYPNYSKSEYGKELNILIKELLELDRINDESIEIVNILKKIYKKFKKFHVRVLIMSNDGRLQKSDFLKKFIDENNEKELLVLQPFGKMGENIFSLNALKNYSDLLINGFNKEGIFIYTMERGVFIPTETLSEEEIIRKYRKYYPKNFYDEIRNLNATQKRVEIDKKINIIKKEVNKVSNEINLIHISDLHLGAVREQKQDRLFNLIKEIKGEKNYCFITGDLLDSPSSEGVEKFLKFEKKLRVTIGEGDIFYVRGNHDSKWRGNISLGTTSKRLLEALANRDESVKEIEKEILLIKVDSNMESPNLAKGKIGVQQMKELKNQIVKKDPQNLRTKMVILHHHPITMVKDKKLKGVIKKYLKNLQQSNLLLEDAEAFLKWCKTNKVQYIFNGHEHLSGYKEEKGIKIVASASSLGATHLGAPEDDHVFCNILKFNKSTKKIESLSQYFQGKRDKGKKDNMTIETIRFL